MSAQPNDVPDFPPLRFQEKFRIHLRRPLSVVYASVLQRPVFHETAVAPPQSAPHKDHYLSARA
ncbi:hypothetical protein IMCC26134_05515 [Verrucomicrobia bacterium IMCC26134]|nr:hypothetical protein IMCC26134_05515 [Verrucomicrobia bacterium IMCC26134]